MDGLGFKIPFVKLNIQKMLHNQLNAQPKSSHVNF